MKSHRKASEPVFKKSVDWKSLWTGPFFHVFFLNLKFLFCSALRFGQLSFCKNRLIRIRVLCLTMACNRNVSPWLPAMLTLLMWQAVDFTSFSEVVCGMRASYLCSSWGVLYNFVELHGWLLCRKKFIGIHCQCVHPPPSLRFRVVFSRNNASARC